MKRSKWFWFVLALALSIVICASAQEVDLSRVGDLSSELSVTLRLLAEQAKDPWERSIYESGAKDITQTDSHIQFYLRSFDPNLKSMPDYAADPNLWREEFFDRVSDYGLEVSLERSSKAPDDINIKQLKSVVSKAAKSAKSAFGNKAVRTAITDLLFQENGSGELALLLQAQSKQTINVKSGPHALVLTCVGAVPVSLVEDAYQTVLDRLSKVHKANAMEESEIEEAFEEALAKRAAALRKKGGKSHDFTLDIDRLIAGDFGEEYESYIRSFAPSPALSQLTDAVRALPDAPAQDFPKNSRISGGRSGTKVIIKAPDDDLGHYVQVRTAKTNQMVTDMFIHSGRSVTVYVPQGMYVLLIATGETWHGMEALFGREGSYSKTGETEVLSKNYYHTFTLVSSDDGNVPLHGSDQSAFQD